MNMNSVNLKLCLETSILWDVPDSTLSGTRDQALSRKTHLVFLRKWFPLSLLHWALNLLVDSRQQWQWEKSPQSHQCVWLSRFFFFSIQLAQKRDLTGLLGGGREGWSLLTCLISGSSCRADLRVRIPHSGAVTVAVPSETKEVFLVLPPRCAICLPHVEAFSLLSSELLLCNHGYRLWGKRWGLSLRKFIEISTVAGLAARFLPRFP